MGGDDVIGVQSATVMVPRRIGRVRPRLPVIFVPRGAVVRRRFLEAYATFRDLYKQASDRLRHAEHPSRTGLRLGAGGDPALDRLPLLDAEQGAVVRHGAEAICEGAGDVAKDDHEVAVLRGARGDTDVGGK